MKNRDKIFFASLTTTVVVPILLLYGVIYVMEFLEAWKYDCMQLLFPALFIWWMLMRLWTREGLEFIAMSKKFRSNFKRMVEEMREVKEKVTLVIELCELREDSHNPGEE